MKHSIYINQRSCIENGFDLDIIDLAIFDVMVFFANSPKCKTMVSEGKIYYWFSWKLFVNELPLIGIKTRDGIRKRILNLRNAQLIEPHEDNQLKAMSWYCFGEKYDLMFTQPAYNDMHPLHTNVCTPCIQTYAPLHTNVCTPAYENMHYKETIDKVIINKENNNKVDAPTFFSENFKEDLREFYNSNSHLILKGKAGAKFFVQFAEVFHNYYFESKEINFLTYDYKNKTALVSIIGKIEKTLQASGQIDLNQSLESQILENFKMMLKENKDDFVNNILSPSIVDKMFDSIILSIKNPKKSKAESKKEDYDKSIEKGLQDWYNEMQNEIK